MVCKSLFISKKIAMESIAIIGTGIAGMGCGHFLHNEFDIEFYEQNDYVGGHTNTVYVQEEGKEIPIDTGFIVFNNERILSIADFFVSELTVALLTSFFILPTYKFFPCSSNTRSSDNTSLPLDSSI